MKKTITVAALALGLIAGSTSPALAHHDGPTYSQSIRSWVCNIAPAICR